MPAKERRSRTSQPTHVTQREELIDSSEEDDENGEQEPHSEVCKGEMEEPNGWTLAWQFGSRNNFRFRVGQVQGSAVVNSHG